MEGQQIEDWGDLGALQLPLRGSGALARLQAAAHSQWEDASVFSGVLLPCYPDPAGRRVGLRVLLQLQGPGW